MDRILVLGATGQLGSDLIRVHRERKSGSILTPFTREECDLMGEITPLLEAIPFDVLINASAYTDTERAEEAKEEAFAVNCDAVGQMARVCHKKGALLVHVSTDYVFDGQSKRPYREEDPVRPQSVYGASKAAGEKYVLQIPKHYLLRCSSLFGGAGPNFVTKMLELGAKRNQLQVIDEITMSPTSSWDLAHAIFDLIEGEAPWGLYHAVNSGFCSWYTFAQKIFQLAKMDVEVLPCSAATYPTRVTRPLYSVLDNQKLAGVVGEIRSWEESLGQYVKERTWQSEKS